MRWFGKSARARASQNLLRARQRRHPGTRRIGADWSGANRSTRRFRREGKDRSDDRRSGVAADPRNRRPFRITRLENLWAEQSRSAVGRQQGFRQRNFARERHTRRRSFGTFTDAASAPKPISPSKKPPYVIKADGLAGGKGVIITSNMEEAQSVVDDILVKKVFGNAGDKLVIEEFLDGEEASFMVLTDGEHVLPLASSQDHKRVFDNDEGPNTGGMGAYSPAPVVTAGRFMVASLREILAPLLAGLKKTRHPLPRRDLRRLDDHQRRPEGFGIQCPLRRPRMPADHDAAEKRYHSVARSDHRRQSRPGPCRMV